VLALELALVLELVLELALELVLVLVLEPELVPELVLVEQCSDEVLFRFHQPLASMQEPVALYPQCPPWACKKAKRHFQLWVSMQGQLGCCYLPPAPLQREVEVPVDFEAYLLWESSLELLV
jgi:hypothetical protein